MIIEEQLKKRYYSISEVAKMFGVAPSLLRFWETVFPSLKPVKSSRGDRRYTKEMVLHIQSIHRLVKEKGYTLEGAKVALKETKEHQKKKDMVLKKLRTLRSSLEQLTD